MLQQPEQIEMSINDLAYDLELAIYNEKEEEMIY